MPTNPIAPISIRIAPTAEDMRPGHPTYGRDEFDPCIDVDFSWDEPKDHAYRDRGARPESLGLPGSGAGAAAVSWRRSDDAIRHPRDRSRRRDAYRPGFIIERARRDQMRIGMPVYDDVDMLDVTGPCEMFGWGGIEIAILAERTGLRRFRNGFGFQVDKALSDARDCDAICDGMRYYVDITSHAARLRSEAMLRDRQLIVSIRPQRPLPVGVSLHVGRVCVCAEALDGRKGALSPDRGGDREAR
ncbi:hypothetical protein Bsp3421_000720 [Burkholderia sp. FERM BP-3421]|uniref:DUF7868 domain-containing protein n=1 Tax=Burkholderia sp. FERM BP-3421 TaxID=1494466 RepID=UPI002360F156|nr:hypothetical protein [Burkholderia sp. FERM BP-3421]WDD90840.1 hypothetical protein Bsp3421_000720 [Burkholderia sp. FERM BP-3421]